MSWIDRQTDTQTGEGELGFIRNEETQGLANVHNYITTTHTDKLQDFTYVTYFIQHFTCYIYKVATIQLQNVCPPGGIAMSGACSGNARKISSCSFLHSGGNLVCLGSHHPDAVTMETPWLHHCSYVPQLHYVAIASYQGSGDGIPESSDTFSFLRTGPSLLEESILNKPNR